MKNVIVGTAGHVDHGKTTLIKAITGVDTDRLKEEKKRGITIELGFADFKCPNECHIGIVDVPGHDKFVNNMLAGAGGIDIALMMVGADEGVKPQTLEHLDILQSLGVKRGIIALTKVDMVEDEEWLEIVKEDIRDSFQGSFLEQGEIVPVSAYTGENLDYLKEVICAMANSIGDKKTDESLLRIPVDRVFTVDGFGTVITGTLTEGSVNVGDRVEIFPANKYCKVRNLQVHGKDVERAVAGQRTAVNLGGISKEDMEKGNVVGYPESIKATHLIDVELDVFPDTKRAITNGSTLHFHYGSAQTTCKISLMDRDVTVGGETVFAQLRFKDPIAIKRREKFIIRFFSPLETIGGGMVLDTMPPKHKRNREEDMDSFRRKASGNDEDAVATMILEKSRNMLNVAEIQVLASLSRKDTEAVLEKLLESEIICKTSGYEMVHRDFLNMAEEVAVKILNENRRKNPISPQLQKEEFKEKLSSALRVESQKGIGNLIDLLVSRGTVVNEGRYMAIPGTEVVYTENQERLRDLILCAYAEEGFMAMTGLQMWERLKQDFSNGKIAVNQEDNNEKTVVHIIEHASAEGKLSKLKDDYFISMKSWRELINILKRHAEKEDTITLAEMRDYTGTSRKFALIIMEAMDMRGLTRLVGEERVIDKGGLAEYNV